MNSTDPDASLTWEKIKEAMDRMPVFEREATICHPSHTLFIERALASEERPETMPFGILRIPIRERDWATGIYLTTEEFAERVDEFAEKYGGDIADALLRTLCESGPTGGHNEIGD